MRFLLNSFLFFLFFTFVFSHPFDGHSHGHHRGGSSDSAACTATGEQIEGPYWLDDALVRSDVRDGQNGVPLYLNFVLVNAAAKSTCEPLVGAAVDIWHTNATGYYGHFTGYDPDKPAKGPATPTDDLTFFRGVQLTDKAGNANFTTIYPGWYYGRCIHIHVEVHLTGSVVDGKFVSGGSDAYIGQVFFDDTITEKIAQLPPYNTHTALTFLRNNEDFIYVGQNGAANALTLVAIDKNNLSLGFTTTFVLNVDTSEFQQRTETARRLTPYWRSYEYEWALKL